MKRIQPTQRQMNEKELTLSLTTSTACHLLIRNLDELSQTTLWSLRLKQIGKQFLNELELYTKRKMWQGEGIEGLDLDTAVSPQDEMSLFMQELFVISLGTGYIPKENVDSLWADMKVSFAKNNIPLQISETGELSLKRLKLEEV